MSIAAKTNVDWVGSIGGRLLAWWLPKLAMAGGLFAAVPARTAIWIAALAWMGLACIFNSRRCGRTHCRYTGPFYLLAIVPVALLGLGYIPGGLAAWIALGAIVVLGSKAIWWLSERAWGRYS